MLVAVYGAMKALFKTSFEGSEQHTINNNSDANTIWRADTPLSLAEAEAIKKCPIPLPRKPPRFSMWISTNMAGSCIALGLKPQFLSAKRMPHI